VRTLTDAVVVPSAAVQYGSRGTYVYLVNEQGQATVRDVVVGPADGPMLSIAQGLKHGETVILEGIDRLREGRPVALVGADGTAPPPSPMGEAGAGAKGEKSGAGKGERSKKKDK
jgi:multidrug efflux system membrane fusion protein